MFNDIFNDIFHQLGPSLCGIHTLVARANILCFCPTSRVIHL